MRNFLIFIITFAVTSYILIALSNKSGAAGNNPYDIKSLIGKIRAVEIPVREINEDGTIKNVPPASVKLRQYYQKQHTTAPKRDLLLPSGCMNEKSEWVKCPVGNVLVIRNGRAVKEDNCRVPDSAFGQTAFMAAWREIYCPVSFLIKPSEFEVN